MIETLAYIEAYFQRTLSEADRVAFEKRIEEEEDFAQEVAIYLTARKALQEELLIQKQKQWTEDEMAKESIPSIAPVKKMYQQKWFIYAAACFILAIAVYLFEKPATTEQIAQSYITENYSHISQTMDGGKDSLQKGIAAFNNKEYDQALLFFNAVAAEDSMNTDAIKYAGLIYLITENYDKALIQFDNLASRKGLFSNPGMFLKGLTLIKRNAEGDTIIAKQLLEQVVKEKLDGNIEAEKLLHSYK